MKGRLPLASLAAALLLVACGGSDDRKPSSGSGPTTSSVTPDASLDGVPVYAYGHSYLASTPGPQGGPPYLALVAERLGMTVVNRAVGGSTAADVAGHVLSTSAWTPGTGGVVVVDSVINDLLSYGDDKGAVAAFSDSLELIVRTLCAGQKTEQGHGSITYSGGWVDGNRLANLSGGTAAFTSEPGAYADIAFSGDEITILTLRYKQGNPGGTMEVVDRPSGRVLASASATGGLPASSAYGYHQLALTVDGLGPGPHTVRFRKAAGDPNPVWLDGYLTPSDTPPTVMLMKAVPLDWTKPTNTAGSAAALAAYNDAIDAVARKFRAHVFPVDPGRLMPAAVKETISSDNVHLNDRGNALYAQALSEALLAADRTPGPCAG